MKKIYLILLLSILGFGGAAQAQRIKVILPDTVLALGPGEGDTIIVRTEGIQLTQQSLWYAQLHLPSCQTLGMGAPLYNNLGQSAFIVDDSTINIIVNHFPENLVMSTLDIDVGMLGGLKMHRDRAMTAYSTGPLQQFPAYTMGSVTARPGETIDVLISNAQHVPDTSGSTLGRPDTSTLTVDFKTNAYAIVVTSTRLVGNNTLATIAVPPNAKPGCYDAYFWEQNANGLIYAQILNDAICVDGPPTEFPARVLGKVWSETDRNCFDNDDFGMKNVVVMAMPGPHYAITGDDGTFEMQLPYGQYTVSQVRSEYITSNCSSSGRPVILDSIQPVRTIGFADSIGNTSDLEVSLWIGRTRVGTEGSGAIELTMSGTFFDSVTVKLVLDDSLHFLRSHPMPNQVIGDTLVYKVAFLSALHPFWIPFDYSVPQNIDLMDSTLLSCVSVKGHLADANLENNTFCGSRTVTASYDPNEKSVLPKGNLNPSDSVLRYTIDFQNTGNDTAFVVVLRDTISPMLDLASIHTTFTTHPCKFRLLGGNVAEWRFENIMLPDSGHNLARSQGAVQFTINRRKDLPLGSLIQNRAAIVFDANPPILTNRTQTFYQNPTRVQEGMSANGAIRVYPNPVQKGRRILQIVGGENLHLATLTLTDMLGKIVLAGQAIESGQVTLDRARLKAGLYHYRISSQGRHVGTGKLVVE